MKYTLSVLFIGILAGLGLGYLFITPIKEKEIRYIREQSRQTSLNIQPQIESINAQIDALESEINTFKQTCGGKG